MKKVFVSYNLRPGITPDQYAAWSREVDQRITPGEKGVIRFEVYRIEGAQKGDPFCQIVEDIEVDDFETFVQTCAGPNMAYVMETFRKYVDESTVQVVYGSKIVPALLPTGSKPPLPQV